MTDSDCLEGSISPPLGADAYVSYTQPLFTKYGIKEYSMVLAKPGYKFQLDTGYFRIDCQGSPNLFHRFMQRLLLGWRWESISD